MPSTATLPLVCCADCNAPIFVNHSVKLPAYCFSCGVLRSEKK